MPEIGDVRVFTAPEKVAQVWAGEGAGWVALRGVKEVIPFQDSTDPEDPAVGCLLMRTLPFVGE